jgi:chitin synthase
MPHPVEVMNSNRLSMQAQVATYDEANGLSFVPDPDDVPLAANRARGVSLADNGPVPGPDGVRRIARARRNSSQRPPQNRYSRNSVYDLPPGAAPPQPGGYSSLGI